MKKTAPQAQDPESLVSTSRLNQFINLNSDDDMEIIAEPRTTKPKTENNPA